MTKEKQTSVKSEDPATHAVTGSTTDETKPLSKKENKAAKKTNQSKKSASSSTASWLATCAVLLAVGVGGAVFWVWQQSNEKFNRLETALTQTRKQAEQQIQQASSQLAAVQAQLKQFQVADEQRRAQTQLEVQHLTDSTRAISERLGRNSTTWILAEAEYLLGVANHRLLLEQDIVTAISALTAADKRLTQVGDPGLLKIRKIIVREISSLKSVEVPDISGMAFELAALASSAEQLPLIVKQRQEQFENAFSSTDEATTRSGNMSGVMKAVWQDLKGLVVIRKNEKPVEALLAPDQRHFLFQNLILKLETGRLAILRGEQVNLKASLDVAQEWLQAYFDRDTASYKNFDATLSRIKQTNLSPAIPDISGSIKALKIFISSKDPKSSVRSSTRTEKEKQFVSKKPLLAPAEKSENVELTTPEEQKESAP